MKKMISILIGVLVVFIGLNYKNIKLIHKYYLSPCYYDNPVKQLDYPQVFFEVDLNEYYQKISELSTQHFNIDTLETIDYKNQQYPVLRISNKEIGPQNSFKKKLLILAGVHGNESAGTLAILELLKEYNAKPLKFKDWEINIVTPVNPAGTIEMSRYNEYGCDLNRKVKTSLQKGIVLQRAIVDSFKPDVIVNMHEAPSSGFLIHSNEHLDDGLLLKLLKDTENSGIVLSNKDYLGRALKIKGNSKISGVFKLFNKLAKVQALGDYVSEKGIVEITTESGWNSKDRFQRINSHALIVSSLIKNYKKGNYLNPLKNTPKY